MNDANKWFIDLLRKTPMQFVGEWTLGPAAFKNEVLSGFQRGDWTATDVHPLIYEAIFGRSPGPTSRGASPPPSGTSSLAQKFTAQTGSIPAVDPTRHVVSRALESVGFASRLSATSQRIALSE